MGLFSPLISFFSSRKCKANNNTKSNASITPPLDNNNRNQHLETPETLSFDCANQEQQPEPLPLSQQQQQPEGASLNQQQRQKPDPSLNQQPSPVNSNAVIPSTSSSLQNHQQQTVNDNVNPVVQSGDKNDDPTIKGVTELGSCFLKDFGRLMDRAELDAQKNLAQMLKADKKQTTTTSTLQNQQQTPVNNNKSGDKKNGLTHEGVMELRKSFLQDIDQLMNTVLFLERVTEMGNNFFQEFDQLMYRVQLDTDKSLSEIKDVVSCMQAATKKTTR